MILNLSELIFLSVRIFLVGIALRASDTNYFPSSELLSERLTSKFLRKKIQKILHQLVSL